MLGRTHPESALLLGGDDRIVTSSPAMAWGVSVFLWVFRRPPPLRALPQGAITATLPQQQGAEKDDGGWWWLWLAAVVGGLMMYIIVDKCPRKPGRTSHRIMRGQHLVCRTCPEQEEPQLPSSVAFVRPQRRSKKSVRKW